MLFETHLVEKDTNAFSKYFSGYIIKWVPAIKSSYFGRASGGCLLGYKTNCFGSNTIKFKAIDDFCLIHIATKSNTNCIDICPIYLNCNNWQTDFNNLVSFADRDNSKTIFLGDFNARTACLQNIPDEITCHSCLNSNRKSKDVKSDVKGVQLLDFCDDNGLIILNGRTPGDREGELTFIGGQGSSVIDYCIAGVDTMSIIENFYVKPLTFSDHMPIEINLALNHCKSTSKILPLPPKLNWSNTDHKIFQTNTLHLSEKLQVELDISPDIALQNIVDCILKNPAVECNPLPKNNNLNPKQPWYDFTCHNARNKSFRTLNLLRDTGSDLVRRSYVMANNKFKEICARKQAEYFEGLCNKLNSMKDASEFWRIVNQLKGRKFKTGSHIEIKDWVEYFSSLLNPPSISNPIATTEPLIRNQMLDLPFSLDELNAVLHKAKANKAPGLDRIPFEYYKHTPDAFKVKIVNCFNNFYEKGVVPSNFKKSIIYPLHKKGDVNLVENYRGNTFLDSISKLYTGLLLNRLVNWVETGNILHEWQAGFRRGYSFFNTIF